MIQFLSFNRTKAVQAIALIAATVANGSPSQAQDSRDLLPLRACARALSINVEGDRFYEGFPSESDDSMYFIDCDENSNLGKDHVILTTKGVYTIFEKNHVDYKGGLYPTLYRFTLENETYYYKSNIVGEMGDVFDFKGDNLSKNPVTSEKRIDTSAKNAALNYYLKTLTGKSDSKAALNAIPLPSERYAKTQACLRKNLSYLGTSIYRTYLARFRDTEIDPETLEKYRNTTVTALSNPGCRVDPELASKFDNFLVNLP